MLAQPFAGKWEETMPLDGELVEKCHIIILWEAGLRNAGGLNIFDQFFKVSAAHIHFIS